MPRGVLPVAARAAGRAAGGHPERQRSPHHDTVRSGAGPLILLAVSVWMLVAMVIAVRQALDFTSTGRAVMVCAAGWVIILITIVLLGGFLDPVAP